MLPRFFLLLSVVAVAVVGFVGLSPVARAFAKVDLYTRFAALDLGAAAVARGRFPVESVIYQGIVEDNAVFHGCDGVGPPLDVVASGTFGTPGDLLVVTEIGIPAGELSMRRVQDTSGGTNGLVLSHRQGLNLSVAVFGEVSYHAFPSAVGTCSFGPNDVIHIHATELTLHAVDQLSLDALTVDAIALVDGEIMQSSGVEEGSVRLVDTNVTVELDPVMGFLVVPAPETGSVVGRVTAEANDGLRVQLAGTFSVLGDQHDHSFLPSRFGWFAAQEGPRQYWYGLVFLLGLAGGVFSWLGFDWRR